MKKLPFRYCNLLVSPQKLPLARLKSQLPFICVFSFNIIKQRTSVWASSLIDVTNHTYWMALSKLDEIADSGSLMSFVCILWLMAPVAFSFPKNLFKKFHPHRYEYLLLLTVAQFFWLCFACWSVHMKIHSWIKNWGCLCLCCPIFPVINTIFL